MPISEFAKQYYEKMFPGSASRFLETDPEFSDLFENFAFDEVINMPEIGGRELNDRTRHIAILATALGCQGIDTFRVMLAAAMNSGVTPVEIKEITYQAVPYLGIARVFPFFAAVNEFLRSNGVPIPLENQATTTFETRRAAGSQALVEIFGDSMRGFWQSGPEESRHINCWLTDNCFGDYYTRKGLTRAERELITFCFLLAQGGCEPQLTNHVLANIRCGNDRLFLIKVVSQCVPFIGYPRCLNALACVNKATEQK